MTRHLTPLIDCDVAVYRCCFAADSGARKTLKEQGLSGDELEQALSDWDYLSHALRNVRVLLDEIYAAFPDRPTQHLYLSGKTNFRDKIATIQPYKGNRDPSHKPKYYDEIKTYLLDVHGAELVEGQEADDAMGIMQWKHKDKSTVICTIDKDLDMIPGYHYNFVKGELYYVNMAAANRQFFMQMLTGDPTDNILGVPKVGIKTAEKILNATDGSLEQMREAVINKYRDYFKDDAERAYHEHANLLWIRREEDQECPY